MVSGALQVYPELYVATGNTQKAVANVRDGDKREDLKLLANMYYNTLQNQVSQRTCAHSLPPRLGIAHARAIRTSLSTTFQPARCHVCSIRVSKI